MRQEVIEHLVLSASLNARARTPAHSMWEAALAPLATWWLNSRTAFWAFAGFCILFGGIVSVVGAPTLAMAVRGFAGLGVALALFAAVIPWYALRWRLRSHNGKARDALKQIIIDHRATAAEWHEAAALIDSSGSRVLDFGMREWLGQWCMP